MRSWIDLFRKETQDPFSDSLISDLKIHSWIFLKKHTFNWLGGFLLWCWSLSTKSHIRPLSTLSRFTLFHLTVECWLDEAWFFNLLWARNSFHTSRTIDNFCKESDTSTKERNYVLFFMFLCLVRTVLLLNHRQTLIDPVKNSSCFLVFFRRKLSANEKPFCYDSDKCYSVSRKTVNAGENFWNVYCFATNQMRDETAKDNRQTAEWINHDLTRNNELAFSSTRNL